MLLGELNMVSSESVDQSVEETLQWLTKANTWMLRANNQEITWEDDAEKTR